MSEKLLIVDDDDINLALMEAILSRYPYELYFAHNGEEAFTQALQIQPDLILMDIMMPKVDGFQALKNLKENEITNKIPVIIVTALHEVEEKVKALEAGAEDFVAKPIEKMELIARVRSLLKIKAYNDFMLNYQRKLEDEVQQKTKILQQTLQDLNQSYVETIYLLSRVSEFRDELTGEHIHRVSSYSALIARNLGLPEEEIVNIQHASSMHDIGKIAIPDSILLKPGKLDSQEWTLMKQHTVIGEKLLRGYRNSLVTLSAEIARSHHERWDGTGYPFGLKQEDIPLSGRIVALADVFDALLSLRPYKQPLSFEQAEKILRKDSGSHFDPRIVEAFLRDKEEIFRIINNCYHQQDVLQMNLA